ncbi:hypothetical protein D3C79_697970 [compost metagenome]
MKGRRCAGQGQASTAGPGGGIGLGLQFAQAGRGVDGRVQLRSNGEGQAFAQLLGQIDRQVDYRFLHVRPGQGHHGLPGGNGLPGFGLPRGNHGSVVGTQGAVVELVAGLADGGARLLQRRAGGFQVGLGNIQLCLGAYPTVIQLLLATGIGLGVDPLCLHLGQIAFGGAQLVLLVGGVQGGQGVTRFHLGAHVQPAPGNAPGNPEAQGAFEARLDTAGEAAQLRLHLGFDLDRQHWPDRLWCLFFATATDQQHPGRQHQQQTLHSSPPGPLASTFCTCMPGCSNWPPLTTTVSPAFRPLATTILPVR